MFARLSLLPTPNSSVQITSSLQLPPQVPASNPHVRKVKSGEEEEEEEEDLVDQLIKKSGCAKEHYLVQVSVLLTSSPTHLTPPSSQECMVEHNDWRKCQQALKTFQACLNNSKK